VLADRYQRCSQTRRSPELVRFRLLAGRRVERREQSRRTPVDFRNTVSLITDGFDCHVAHFSLINETRISVDRIIDRERGRVKEEYTGDGNG